VPFPGSLNHFRAGTTSSGVPSGSCVEVERHHQTEMLITRLMWCSTSRMVTPSRFADVADHRAQNATSSC